MDAKSVVGWAGDVALLSCCLVAQNVWMSTILAESACRLICTTDTM